MQNMKGFTLIELMIAVVIIALLAGIALPSYQQYVRNTHAAQAQQEVLKLVEQLERYKSRNFSYRGFDPKYLYGSSSAISEVNFPNSDDIKYVITIADISTATSTTLLSSDSGLGKRWAIRVIPTKVNYDAFLVTDRGVRCKTEYLVSGDLTDIKNYVGCGSKSEKW